jgi:hypothetical protein
VALGLSRRATELLEWLDVEKGGDNQLQFEPTALVELYSGDISLWGPIQSRAQIFVHGNVSAVAGQFSGLTFQAGPKGAWVSDFICINTLSQVRFDVQATANQVLVNVSREDLAVPGLIPTVIEDFNFVEAQYGVANPLPQGGILIGGTFAAPQGGTVLGTTGQTPWPRDPIFIPPGRGITLSATIINSLIAPQFRIVEGLAFFGRNFGDRPG